MWYEILPTLAIVWASYAVPVAGVWAVHKLAFGNPYKRDLRHGFDLKYYLRDWRLTGDVYKQQGLEGIPDGDDGK